MVLLGPFRGALLARVGGSGCEIVRMRGEESTEYRGERIHAALAAIILAGGGGESPREATLVVLGCEDQGEKVRCGRQAHVRLVLGSSGRFWFASRDSNGVHSLGYGSNIRNRKSEW